MGLNLHDPFIPGVEVGSLKILSKTRWEELEGEVGQKCVFGYRKDEEVGLAGPEGALFPSVGAPALVVVRLAVCRKYIEPTLVPAL